MRKRVGQEVVTLPSESFKTSDPPLTLFNKIVTLRPRTKVLQKIAPGLDKDTYKKRLS